MPSVARDREQLLKSLFPGGIPGLWCPILTHYQKDGSINRARMLAHLRHLSNWVQGILVPGSTSDGWELSPEETREVLEIALGAAQELRLHLPVARRAARRLHRVASFV